MHSGLFDRFTQSVFKELNKPILPNVGNGYPTNKSQVYVSNWFTVAFPNITDSSVLDLALSVLTPKNDPITLLHSFAIKSSMFKGDCLSLNTDNGHASLSRYVMLCHASDTTLPLFGTSVTVANIDNPRSDYNKCEYAQMSQSNVQIKKSIARQQPDSSSLAIL